MKPKTIVILAALAGIALLFFSKTRATAQAPSASKVATGPRDDTVSILPFE